jgi:hypothetical protein
MNYARTTIFLLSQVCVLSARVIPLVNFRSQGVNAARELVGWQRAINLSSPEQMYGSLTMTAEYTRSLESSDMAKALFQDALYCTCKASTFYVEGSMATKRHSNALMAEQFYLPTDFSSRVSIDPVISNGIVDVNGYWGLDNLLDGLYFRLHVPIVHTRWALNFCEEVIDYGNNDYDPGYFDDVFVPDNYLSPVVHGLERTKMLHQFSDYIVDGKAITGVSGITYNGLEYARIGNHALTKNGVAEVTAALGWNFRVNDQRHVGIQLRGAAPTGNRPEGRYLFEPIVGNGKHPELGAGLTCHWRLWQSEDEQRDFGLYFDGNVTHLFRVHQWRTFDLACNPLSRYMLVMRFTDEIDNLVGLNGRGEYVAPQQQFAQEFTPLANLTTLPVESGVPVQVDMALKLSYAGRHVEIDFGYNLWARSCERLWRKTDWCSRSMSNTWGLKGNAYVFGFASTATPFVIENPGIPLSATQSEATIFAGTNSASSDTTNDGIDCPVPAYDNTLPTHQPLWAYENGEWQHVDTSFPGPELILESDIDLNGACTRGLSQKLFAHISYRWQEKRWQPFLGIGGEGEWGTCNGFNPRSCPRECNYCSLSQWGIWLKGGLSF